jgi:hypothetical protein
MAASAKKLKESHVENEMAKWRLALNINENQAGAQWRSKRRKAAYQRK